MRKLFITGTDTEVGKTFVTQAMMIALRQQGASVIGFKPVAAGGEKTAQGWQNEDAQKLRSVSSIELGYEQVNPILYREPVAPHLAAMRHQQPIDLDRIGQAYLQLCAFKPGFLLTEGAGGWRTPISDTAFLSEVAIEHNMSVILVVGMKLGCLNHARLTAEAIRADGLQLAGWVANIQDTNMPYLSENIDALQSILQAPRIGVVPHLTSVESAVPYLDCEPLC